MEGAAIVLRRDAFWKSEDEIGQRLVGLVEGSLNGLQQLIGLMVFTRSDQGVDLLEELGLRFGIPIGGATGPKGVLIEVVAGFFRRAITHRTEAAIADRVTFHPGVGRFWRPQFQRLRGGEREGEDESEKNEWHER